MQNPLSPELIEWGAKHAPSKVSPGKLYWRLVEAAGPMDIGGNHHLYVDVWDEQGKRAVGIPVRFYTSDEGWTSYVEEKPGEPYGVNLPLFAGGESYGVYVFDALPSDSLFGVGLGDHVPHHSFRAIFQLTRAKADDAPVISPPPTPGKVSKVKLYLDDVLVFER